MNLNMKTADLSKLRNRTVAITGTTGGLGSAICEYLLSYDVKLYMINRNEKKTGALTEQLLQKYPDAKIKYFICDLSDINQVKQLASRLRQLSIDVLMLNAGVYAIPRAVSSAGYDSVFQTNFLSHYFLVKSLYPQLAQQKSKVVVTGSIAHRFHPIDPCNPDFSNHSGANNIYGNSKRFLMFSLMELLKDTPVSFAIGHPGISPTGITGSYPPLLLKIVKPAMKLLFMHPEKACLGVLKAACETVPYCHWAGPAVFDIWGKPVIKSLHSCPLKERQQIYEIAEEMYRELSKET